MHDHARNLVVDGAGERERERERGREREREREGEGGREGGGLMDLM